MWCLRRGKGWCGTCTQRRGLGIGTCSRGGGDWYLQQRGWGLVPAAEGVGIGTCSRGGWGVVPAAEGVGDWYLQQRGLGVVPAAEGVGIGTCSRGGWDWYLQQRGGKGERGMNSHMQKVDAATYTQESKLSAHVHVHGAPRFEASQ